jgi:hypothetical protein
MNRRKLLARLVSGAVQNVAEVAGQAKPYQIRQLLRLVERSNLRLEDL